MNFSDMTWRRKFSMNLCKSLNVPMASMTFSSDFTVTDRGNLYPLIAKSEGTTEKVSPTGYSVKSEGGYAERLFCSLFPFATYRMKLGKLDGAAGFVFKGEGAECKVMLEKDDWDTNIRVTHADGEDIVKAPSFEPNDNFALVVTLRPGFFDVYICENGKYYFIHTSEVPSFNESNKDSFYNAAKVHVRIEGRAKITLAESYVDCGIGQADIRPFRYENGDIIVENGRIFLTFSVRLASGAHQGVFSWVPGTSDFRMEGALFYSVGDGYTHGDVATAFVFNRRDKKWHLWQRSAAAGHVLAYACFEADVRYGVNIIDVKPLPHMTEENRDDEAFLGKKGDEDPDFIYDEETNKWYFALCRVADSTKKYQYFFFESDRPDSGYKCIGRGPVGDETGGSIVRLNGKLRFVCGNSFHAVSEYRVYNWGEFDKCELLKCDYPDGGFRGWGTVMPIDFGTRRRYFWLTFDRTLMSSVFNWSYGNIYCFEAEGPFVLD